MEIIRKGNTELTTTEISNLWNGYVLESMVHHIFAYFLNNVEDTDIEKYIKYVREASGFHLDKYTDIFRKEYLPMPRGTTSDDVNVNAPRLFTDVFYLTYIKNLAKFALTNSVMALTESSRNDIRNLFNDYSIKLIEVDNAATELLLSKEIYPMPPQFNNPKQVEFIEDKKFFAGFFGDKRQLSVLELKQLFQNTHLNELGKMLMIGFAKVTKSKELQEYFLKGKDLSGKFVKQLSDKLQNEDITPPPSLESEVVKNSNVDTPFSDRFMLNHAVFLNAYGIGNYGLALAQSQRRDLSAMYAKIMVEVGLYADNGVDLLIENNWLEQPPLIGKQVSSS